MAFWKKDGEIKKNSAVSETAHPYDESNESSDSQKSTQLFDVSSLNIPESDREGGFKEDVEIESGHLPPFPTFLSQGPYNNAQQSNKEASESPSSFSHPPLFKVPPIPRAPEMPLKSASFLPTGESDKIINDSIVQDKEPVYEENTTLLPENKTPAETVLTEQEYEEAAEDFTLPPLPEEETVEVTEEETAAETVPTEQEYEEVAEDFTLPPLPEEETVEVTEEETAAETVPTEQEYEEEAEDFTLPPLPEEEEAVEVTEEETAAETVPTEQEYEEEAEDMLLSPSLPEEPADIGIIDSPMTESIEKTLDASSEENQFSDKKNLFFEDNALVEKKDNYPSNEPVQSIQHLSTSESDSYAESKNTDEKILSSSVADPEEKKEFTQETSSSINMKESPVFQKLPEKSQESNIDLSSLQPQTNESMQQDNTANKEQDTEKPVLPQPPKANTFVRQIEPIYEAATEKTGGEETAPSTDSKETLHSNNTALRAPVENAGTSLNSMAKQTMANTSAQGGGTPPHPHVMTKADYASPSFLKNLFANGNVCITAPGGSFPIKDDTRILLALFSNGRFFVSETYKFDGKVLGFEYLAKKRHLQIGKPEYVSMPVLNSIYEYAAQNHYTPEVERDDEEEQAQARMQRDFITIVSRAAAMHVSDIHIVVAEHTTVMFRVNGLMQTEMEYNKDWGESFVRAAFASADISDSNYAQNEYQAAQKLGRTPLRGSRGKLILPRNVLGIRLQFNPIAFGTRYVVMRLLYAEENADTSSALEALGFTKRETDFFYQLRGMPTGITIISGPTGSGKSTTLQRNMIAMLQERNYEINLITVEDPPEYPIPGARQMPVTNASIEEAKEREFTKALSAALRSDPDSLMIGEVRTLSAADLAFRGALSGHNVWTTLHANSAPAILMRLKDLGVEDFKLRDPEIVKGLLAQRLFRKLCPHCRIPATEMLNNPSVQRLRESFGDIGLETSYLRGKGCKYCDFRGVKGRLAVAEIILPDSTFLDLMSKGDTKKALNYWINDLNGMTLREVALQHMFRGIIDIAEVERWTGFLNQVVLG